MYTIINIQLDRTVISVYTDCLLQDVTWETAEEGWGGNNGDGTFSPPKANTNVKIRNGTV